MTRQERRWLCTGLTGALAPIAFAVADGWLGYVAALAILFLGQVFRIRFHHWFYDD